MKEKTITKKKCAVISLASCSGCIATLMSLEIITEMLRGLEIIFFPFLSDSVTLDDCEVILVEGCVISEDHAALARTARQASKKVIALGTCACHGGIPCMNHDINARPLSDVIKIDGMIPGCPVPPSLLSESLMRLFEGKNVLLSKKTLCDGCPRHNSAEFLQSFKISKLAPAGDKASVPEGDCFLRHGIACLGPVTRAGCEWACMHHGMPCEGCMGPVDGDFTAALINLFSLHELSPSLETYAGIYFRFSKPRL